MSAASGIRLLAGHPVVDLVNTVRWRLDPVRRDDVLHTFEDAVRFSAEAGLITPAEQARITAKSNGIAQDRGELDRVKRLREAVHAVLLDHDETATAMLVEAFHRAAAHARLEHDGTAWSWVLPETDHLLEHRIALMTEELLRSPDSGATRQCDDAHCGWIYLDHSPRHNRRWCASDDCGNRNRVRQHYARARAGRKSALDSDASDRTDA